jgi:hypothetical protein
MLSVIMLSVVMLSDVMLSVVILSVVVFSEFMLSILAPFKGPLSFCYPVLTNVLTVVINSKLMYLPVIHFYLKLKLITSLRLSIMKLHPC